MAFEVSEAGAITHGSYDAQANQAHGDEGKKQPISQDQNG